MNLRLAVRNLFKNPFVTIMAILSLGLGIGANAAIFSLFDQILLRNVPIPEPERLVNLSSPGPRGQPTSPAISSAVAMLCSRTRCSVTSKKRKPPSPASLRTFFELCIYLTKSRRRVASHCSYPAAISRCWVCGPRWVDCLSLRTKKRPARRVSSCCLTITGGRGLMKARRS